MNLVELEFKPEDFVFKGDVKVAVEYHPDWIARCVADQANLILRKKLVKAPEVYGFKGLKETVWHTHPVGGDHSTARLVCVEEINK